ncbi:PREDICTED: uncharacterized protein LOC105566212 [Vollenhovia emeryi]|uniref:uncharacterized protein LOC105566212 n=1 Tax=Vollenhovia emeryi TaxID=411798 RepID=UPI0005F38FC0|nr:PREDICTED: uncharacterized protein LOC105566212 [Vollenhovia emeryi]
MKSKNFNGDARKEEEEEEEPCHHSGKAYYMPSVKREYLSTIDKDRNAAQTTFSLSADDGNGSTTRPPATEHWAICVSDMRESILPTDCRGCGRGRPLSSLTQTTTIDLAGTGSPSTSTNTAPERISTATDSPPWTPDSSYAYVETPPPTDGTPPPCREYSLKPADTTAAYFYILCLTVIILGSFLIYFPMIVNAMTD